MATRAAQRDLWRSVLTGDRRLAFEAEEALSVSSNVSRDGPRDGADDVRRLIPVRVYVETSDTRKVPGRASRRDVVWTSAPVPVVLAAENGASRKATALVVTFLFRRKQRRTDSYSFSSLLVKKNFNFK